MDRAPTAVKCSENSTACHGGQADAGPGHCGRLDALHVGGVESLRPRLDLELDLLTLGERFEPIHCDRGEVDEDVLASLLFDETVPLRVIEPLHFPSGHCALPPTE